MKKAIKNSITTGKYSNIYAIADGSAFGSEVSKLVEYLLSPDFEVLNADVNIFLPESFEYLLLSTHLFDIPDLKDKLENTENYCEASKFITWERYYTYLMKSVGYSKSRLSKDLLNNDVIEGVYASIPDLDKSVIVGVPKI